MQEEQNLNTSYVKVQFKIIKKNVGGTEFKYILC